MGEQAEKDKAEKEKQEALRAQQAATAATPMASGFGPSEPFVKMKEPADSVVEPCFDVMTTEEEKVERFLLDASKKTEWQVGRQTGLVDFVVSHESCSRTHCQLQLWNGQIMITDLDTPHGTTVDGRMLPKNVPIRLVTGANVKFGAAPRVYIFRMPKFHSKAMIAAAQSHI